MVGGVRGHTRRNMILIVEKQWKWGNRGTPKNPNICRFREFMTVMWGEVENSSGIIAMRASDRCLETKIKLWHIYLNFKQYIKNFRNYLGLIVSVCCAPNLWSPLTPCGVYVGFERFQAVGSMPPPPATLARIGNGVGIHTEILETVSRLFPLWFFLLVHGNLVLEQSNGRDSKILNIIYQCFCGVFSSDGWVSTVCLRLM